MIEYIECESGDWFVLFVNGHDYIKGHSIPTLDLLMFLHDNGLLQLPFKHKTISDQDMEEGKYHD